MNTQTEREKFEAWVLRAWVTPVWIERADLAAQGDRLTYCERKTRDVWEGWQARASLAQGDAAAPDGTVPSEQTPKMLIDATRAQDKAMSSFDEWQQNPYTKVLEKSIAEDYMPRFQTVAAPPAVVVPMLTFDALLLIHRNAHTNSDAYDEGIQAAIIAKANAALAAAGIAVRLEGGA